MSVMTKKCPQISIIFILINPYLIFIRLDTPGPAEARRPRPDYTSRRGTVPRASTAAHGACIRNFRLPFDSRACQLKVGPFYCQHSLTPTLSVRLYVSRFFGMTRFSHVVTTAVSRHRGRRCGVVQAYRRKINQGKCFCFVLAFPSLLCLAFLLSC